MLYNKIAPKSVISSFKQEKITMKDTMHEVLNKYWGFAAFRPLQEEIILSILSGKDTLAVLPTGGGKSLCYQIPGMIHPGLCLVVSPIIALMKDQVYQLTRRGIKAFALVSGMSQRERMLILDNCLYNKVKFLFVSPERLETELFKARLSDLTVNLLAVDEAHCISQWGYDFRPPYLRIAEVRKQLSGIPVLALTASATVKVREDIMDKLHFKAPNIFRSGIQRPALKYMVLQEDNKLQRLAELLEQTDGSALVYVRSRRKTRQVAEWLKGGGFNASFYHAGLDAKERQAGQEAWTKGKIRIMVCTNAFGMGIDKADVRLVAHLDLPESLEAYYQEAGRAGRDGKKAYAVLLIEPKDLHDIEAILSQRFPPTDILKKIYRAIGHFLDVPLGSGQFESYDFDLNAFCGRFKFDFMQSFYAIKLLEQEAYLTLSDRLELSSRVHITQNNREVYTYEVNNPAFEPLLKFLLRNYPGIFSQMTRINERQIGRNLKMHEEEIVKQLKRLEQEELLDYEIAKNKPQLTFMGERIPDKNVSINESLMKQRKTAYRERLQAMNAYATGRHKCRSQVLAAYFGESTAPRCGQCDVCTASGKLHMDAMLFDQILESLEEKLSAYALDENSLIEQLPDYSKEDVLSIIRWLLDQKMLQYNESNQLIWQA